ncbi:MAG: hypothetical protein VSS75_013590 [Candidatus Parabeggiatoa sp.]|nr:hypothetical protein [Candidatus Parabeggiatoa sp.]
MFLGINSQVVFGGQHKPVTHPTRKWHGNGGQHKPVIAFPDWVKYFFCNPV